MTQHTFQTTPSAPTQRLIQTAWIQTDSERRWDYLCAAHIVAQQHFRLHLRVHVAMLRLAWIERDFHELIGQLLRLALTPPGHLLGRLPAGNPGRATAHALRSLPVPAKLQNLIQSVS